MPSRLVEDDRGDPRALALERANESPASVSGAPQRHPTGRVTGREEPALPLDRHGARRADVACKLRERGCDRCGLGVRAPEVPSLPAAGRPRHEAPAAVVERQRRNILDGQAAERRRTWLALLVQAPDRDAALAA